MNVRHSIFYNNFSFKSRMLKIVTFLASSIVINLSFHQSSFAQFEPLDCDQASKFVEKTICSNPKLSSLDQEIYAQLDNAEQVTKVPLLLLELTQQNWIKQRNYCKNTACIEMSAKTRLSEVKKLNAMNQDFVQYFIRVKKDQPDEQLSVMQLQNLDEKRVRVIGQTFWNSSNNQYGQVLNFSGYANQGKKITIKDLDTGCVLKLNQHKAKLEVRQASPMCGNKNLRFSGSYQAQQ